MNSLSLDRTTINQEGTEVEIERVAAKVDEIISALATTNSNITGINTKFSNLNDPITITLSTWTEAGVNTALATLETQQKATIATLKA
jgi:hypothetical protein